MMTSNGVGPNIPINPPSAPNQILQPQPTPEGRPGLTAGVWSIICAALALFFFPPVFGILGIYLGHRAKKKGRITLGTVGIALSIVCMILGMIIGALFNIWQSGHK